MFLNTRSAVLMAALVVAGGVAMATDQAQSDPGPAQKVGKQRSWPRVRLGGIFVNAGYSHYSGGRYYGGPWGYGYSPYFYDPWFYRPYYWGGPFMGSYFHPGFMYGYPMGASMGEVKIQTPDRDAWVYLDGGLAGQAHKLKSMWLEPGKYNIEVRSGDRRYEQKIYVLSGKTLKLKPEFDVREQRQ